MQHSKRARHLDRAKKNKKKLWMVKIRTVIPASAKPGSSIIQVMHPKTGKPNRVRVPIGAIPGQVIELELPDAPEVNASAQQSVISTKLPRKEASKVPKELLSANKTASTNIPKDMHTPPNRTPVSKKDVSPNIPIADTSNQGNVAQTPPPTQLPMPPFGGYTIESDVKESENDHLLPSGEMERKYEEEITDTNCCTSCLMNPVRFFKALF